MGRPPRLVSAQRWRFNEAAPLRERMAPSLAVPEIDLSLGFNEAAPLRERMDDGRDAESRA